MITSINRKHTHYSFISSLHLSFVDSCFDNIQWRIEEGSLLLQLTFLLASYSPLGMRIFTRQMVIHYFRTSFKSSLFRSHLRALGSSPFERARSLTHASSSFVSFVLRARFCCFHFHFSFRFARHGRPLAKESWQRGSISHPSVFILTNKPIKPPWLD